jgi:hypothetical protein
MMATAVVAAGCGGGEEKQPTEVCNEFGCPPIVSLDLRPLARAHPDWHKARLCIDGGCGTTLGPHADAMARGQGTPPPPGRVVEVRYELLDPDKRVVATDRISVRLRRDSESPACESKLCVVAPVTLDPKTLRWVAVPAAG